MNPTTISNLVSNAFESIVPAGPAPESQPTYAAAFARKEAAIRAVPLDALAAIGVDVIGAMATVLGTLPRLRSMRDDVAKLPHFDLAVYDALEDYTLALGAAQSQWMIATMPREALPTLGAAAVAVRDTLVADASALARRGVLDATFVASFKSGVGYRAVVRDLLGLTALLRANWSAVADMSALDEGELIAASNLAERIVSALGEREQNPAKTAEAALVRQQTYTLWLRAYEQARRAVEFLRWNEGDADKIAPSLFAGRGAHTKADPAQPATPEAPASPTTTQPAAKAPASPAAATAYGPAGTPNSSPFLA